MTKDPLFSPATVGTTALEAAKTLSDFSRISDPLAELRGWSDPLLSDIRAWTKTMEAESQFTMLMKAERNVLESLRVQNDWLESLRETELMKAVHGIATLDCDPLANLRDQMMTKLTPLSDFAEMFDKANDWKNALARTSTIADWIEQSGALAITGPSTSVAEMLMPFDGASAHVSINDTGFSAEAGANPLNAAVESDRASGSPVEEEDRNLGTLVIATAVFCEICGEELLVKLTKHEWIDAQHLQLDVHALPFCSPCTRRANNEPGYLSDYLASRFWGARGEQIVVVPGGSQGDGIPRGKLVLIPLPPDE